MGSSGGDGLLCSVEEGLSCTAGLSCGSSLTGAGEEDCALGSEVVGLRERGGGGTRMCS